MTGRSYSTDGLTGTGETARGTPGSCALSRWEQVGHGCSNQRAGLGQPCLGDRGAPGSQYRQSGHELTQ